LITQPAYGRSNPRVDGLFHYVGGYRGYDNGGNQVLINCTFVNFTSRAERKMGALVNSNTGQFGTYPDNVCHSCKFINAVPMLAATNLSMLFSNTTANGLCYVDASGSVIPGGGYLAGNQSLFSTLPGAVARPESNGYTIPANHGRMVAQHVFLNPYGKSTTNPVVSGDNNIYREPAGPSESYRFRPLGSSPNGPYAISPGKTPVPSLRLYSVLTTDRGGRRLAMGPYLDIGIPDARPGDWNVIAVPLPSGTKYNITFSGIDIVQADRWEDLSPWKSWYNSTNEHLYVLIAPQIYLYYLQPYMNMTSEGYDQTIGRYSYYQIRSDCVNCGVGTSYVVPNMPSVMPYSIRYDKYSADLVVSGGKFSGKMFAQLYPYSFLSGPALSFQIWHNLVGGSVDLYATFEDSRTGLKMADNVIGQSSYVMMFRISRDMWLAATSGNLRVSIRKVSDGSQVLSGILLLEDPNSYYFPSNTIAKCVPAPNTNVTTIYNGTFTNAQWYANGAKTNQIQGLCSNKPLAITSGSVIILNKGSVYSVPTKFNSIEFYIRASQVYKNYNFYNLSLVADTPSGTKKVDLYSNNIHDFVINSNGWAFVRVNLASIGRNITSLKFSYFHWSWESDNILFIDQLRFSDATDLPAIPMDRIIVNPIRSNAASVKSTNEMATANLSSEENELRGSNAAAAPRFIAVLALLSAILLV